MLFSASVPAGLYDRLYPPGWCLVPALEVQHQDAWTSLRTRITEAGIEARTLLQILLIIQVSALIELLLELKHCRVKNIYWNI